MKRLLPVIALVALVAVLIMLAAGTALACPRAHPVLVMNVTYKVTNDEASGNVGLWALQDYTRHVQVWRLPDGSFDWESRYEGRWTTFAGGPRGRSTSIPWRMATRTGRRRRPSLPNRSSARRCRARDSS